MEVAEVYKDTKIGRIPKDWEVNKLNDVISLLKSGLSRMLSTQDIGTPVIRSSNMINYNIDFNDLKYWYLIDPKGSNMENYYLKNGDILINFINSMAHIGKSVVYINDIGRDVIYTTNILRLVLNDNVNDTFFFYLTQSKLYENFISKITNPAVNQASFTTRDFRNFRFPSPPLPEQQKIVEILSTVDEQISTTQAIIDKSKELKKGLMQKLFSEGIGHTEFKDTKIGRIPKDWEVVKLGDYSKLLTGGTPSTKVQEYWGGDIPWMASGDIHKRYIEDVEGRITDIALKNSAAKIIPVNSILIALNGQGRTKGTVAININELTCNQSLAAYVLKEDAFHPLFVLFYLTTRYWHLRALAGGDDRAGLNLGLLRSVKCPLPHIEEQKKIAEILSEADAKIEKEENEKAKLEQLKKGLMQQLLTGKKRVKV